MKTILLSATLTSGLVLAACIGTARMTPTVKPFPTPPWHIPQRTPLTRTLASEPTASDAMPEVIPHEKPHLAVNTELLRRAGCVQGVPSSQWSCSGNDAIAALGCDNMIADDLLGGLTPPYPTMRCEHQASQGEPPHEGFYKSVGCRVPRYSAYIVFLGDKYRLVTYASDFRDVFAPIESADEALSYALVSTDLVAVYEIEESFFLQSGFLVDVIEETHVEETSDGYMVHLFAMGGTCGCTTHTTSAVDVLVTRGGETTIAKSELVSQFYACLD